MGSHGFPGGRHTFATNLFMCCSSDVESLDEQKAKAEAHLIEHRARNKPQGDSGAYRYNTVPPYLLSNECRRNTRGGLHVRRRHHIRISHSKPSPTHDDSHIHGSPYITNCLLQFLTILLLKEQLRSRRQQETPPAVAETALADRAAIVLRAFDVCM